MRFLLLFFSVLFFVFGCQDSHPKNTPEVILDEIVSTYISDHLHPDGYIIAYGTDLMSSRDSMIAALYFAKTGKIDIAERLIKFVLPLQYLGSMQRHYGNFLKFEEDKPPLDYNWSAFIGSYLVLLYKQYKDNFSNEFQVNIRVSNNFFLLPTLKKTEY